MRGAGADRDGDELRAALWRVSAADLRRADGRRDGRFHRAVRFQRHAAPDGGHGARAHGAAAGAERHVYQAILLLLRHSQPHVQGFAVRGEAGRQRVLYRVLRRDVQISEHRRVRAQAREPALPGGREAGRRRHERQRQDDLHQAALPPVRPHRGRDSAQRRGYSQVRLR